MARPQPLKLAPPIKALLQRGYIFLPEGEYGNVISFTPPLTITQPQLAKAVAALKEILGHRLKHR